ncbi:PAAF1 [Lepeophtheirus salmonis]|uniref:PAAF1 n=1 Tax=Lepeophtheirus salmonis TaxID=72036 RepID=A0A7R8D6N2_LEPSM|nr:PAAF1 [Lepeophtheirus salmonis]CAF3042553.1 PAAF1 [Lepeophtheirus salmonis]
MSHLGKKYPPESTNTDEFQVQSYGPHHLTVTFNNTNEMRFVGTKDVFASIHHHSNVTHMDISKGGIGVSLGKEGKKSVFRIWECSTGIIRRELDGHCGYGYSVRLFPSGIVIITSGGHTAGVNDTAIVGIGKNVVSVSNDSTIRLWNCGSGLCLDVISKIDDVPIICEINDYIFNCNSHNLKERKEGEHDTENKLLVVGCEKGLIVGVNIFDRAVVFQNKIDSGIKDIKFNGENGILVGCENGSLHKYSLNSLNGEMSLQLERVWLDSESSIESLLVVSDGVFCRKKRWKLHMVFRKS